MVGGRMLMRGVKWWLGGRLVDGLWPLSLVVSHYATDGRTGWPCPPNFEEVGTGSIVLIRSLTLLTRPFSNISRRVDVVVAAKSLNFLKLL